MSPTHREEVESALQADSAAALPSFDWQSNFFPLTRIGRFFMPAFGDGDSMTEIFNANTSTSYKPSGSDGFHETWYLSRDPAADTAPFYRLFSPNTGINDHMDSPNPNEAVGLGYHLEYLLGYPWLTQYPGMQPITRYLKSSIFDHRTSLGTVTPSGYTLDARYDSATSTPRFGYQRFANLTDRASVLAVGYADSLSNAALRVNFNQIYGNAIGKITWLPLNAQLVSEDIGDMVQSTLFGGVEGNPNPTQSGGADFPNYWHTNRYAGSPIITRSYSGTNPRTQTTESRPLNFNFNQWAGTDPLVPLAWRGTFRKTTTLGFQLDAATILSNVVKIRFEAKRDTTAPPSMVTLWNMNNTGFYKFCPSGQAGCLLGDPNTNANVKLELLNARANTVQDLGHPSGGFSNYLWVCSSANGPCDITQDLSRRAMLVGKADGSFVIGVYSKDNSYRYKLQYLCGGGSVSGQCNPPSVPLIILDTFQWQVLGTQYGPAVEQYVAFGTRTDVIRTLRRVDCKINSGVNCSAIQ